MAYDVTKTRLGAYDVGWTKAGGSSYAHGAVDKVEPILKLKLRPIKVGSMGDCKLGDRIIGLEDDSKVIVAARELDLAFFQGMCPWFVSGSILGVPATNNKDLYDYAGPLIVHPNDVSGTSLDLTILKACPLRNFMIRDGVNDDMVAVEYIVYPDRGSFPTKSYFYVGAAP